MSRDFPYRRAPIPNITEPVYDEDGYATTQMRAWMEAVEIQRGPTLDATYDLQLAVDEAVSDGVLTPNEKRDIIPQINALLAEETALVARAAALSLSTAAYEAAVAAFETFLAGLTEPVAWDDLTGNTTIADPDAFIDLWQAVIQAANALKRQIESFIPQAVLDSILSPAEKRIIVPQIKALQNEEASLVTAAGNLSISTTVYESAQDNLASYLATLTTPVAWDDRSAETNIASPSTFISRQQSVIEARDALLAEIADANVNWPRVVNVNITETQITDGAISTPKLAANAVTADKINVNSLDAVTANMGNLNVNGILSVQSAGRLDIAGTGNNFIRIGALGGGSGLGISVRATDGSFPLIIDTVAGVFTLNGATLINSTINGSKVASGALERRTIATDSSPGVYFTTTMTERISFTVTTVNANAALDVEAQCIVLNRHSADVHVGAIVEIDGGAAGARRFTDLLPFGIERTLRFRVTSSVLSAGTHTIKVYFVYYGARSGTPSSTDIEMTYYDVTCQEVERVSVTTVTSATVSSGGSTSPGGGGDIGGGFDPDLTFPAP